MLLILLSVLFLVFLINLIPAFTPPTWMLISATAFSFELSTKELLVLSIFGALSATIGRSLLALLSNKIIRNKIISEKAKENVDEIKKWLENKKTVTSGVFFIYSLSPLPSGQLFLAYGLTALKIVTAAIPFFFGRVLTYSLLALSASKLSESIDIQNLDFKKLFSVYFIVGQILALTIVYIFVKIDWRKVIYENKFGFISKIDKNNEQKI